MDDNTRYPMGLDDSFIILHADKIQMQNLYLALVGRIALLERLKNFLDGEDIGEFGPEIIGVKELIRQLDFQFKEKNKD